LAKKNPYIDFLLEQFEPLGEIHARPMFGGHGMYCDGVFFALVANDAVFLKGDEVNRPDFVARGMRPFRPYEDRPDTMHYYEAPAEIFEDSDLLKLLAGSSVAAGVRAQAGKKPKKRR